MSWHSEWSRDYGVTNAIARTIRSHEQNQEHAYIAASNQRVGPVRFTNRGPKRPSACRGTLSRKKRCTRRLTMCSLVLTGGRRPKGPPTTTELASGHDRQLHETEVNRNFAQCFPEVDQILSRRWSTQSILMVSPPPSQS